MTDHTNDMAENAPIKVRFTHIGADAGDGIQRPLCRPGDLKLQLVKDQDKATCPHCKTAIIDFNNWVALQIAQGRLPPVGK